MNGTLSLELNCCISKNNQLLHHTTERVVSMKVSGLAAYEMIVFIILRKIFVSVVLLLFSRRHKVSK